MVLAALLPSMAGTSAKCPVVPPTVVNVCVTLNAWLFVLRNVHVAVVGANDSAAPKSRTGSTAPDAGFRPRRMIIRSTGIADGSGKSAFRAATASSGPAGRFNMVKLPVAVRRAEPPSHADLRRPESSNSTKAATGGSRAGVLHEATLRRPAGSHLLRRILMDSRTEPARVDRHLRQSCGR